jgi:hypothetical protein
MKSKTPETHEEMAEAIEFNCHEFLRLNKLLEVALSEQKPKDYDSTLAVVQHTEIATFHLIQMHVNYSAFLEKGGSQNLLMPNTLDTISKSGELFEQAKKFIVSG